MEHLNSNATQLQNKYLDEILTYLVFVPSDHALVADERGSRILFLPVQVIKNQESSVEFISSGKCIWYVKEYHKLLS